MKLVFSLFDLSDSLCNSQFGPHSKAHLSVRTPHFNTEFLTPEQSKLSDLRLHQPVLLQTFTKHLINFNRICQVPSLCFSDFHPGKITLRHYRVCRSHANKWWACEWWEEDRFYLTTTEHTRLDTVQYLTAITNGSKTLAELRWTARLTHCKRIARLAAEETTKGHRGFCCCHMIIAQTNHHVTTQKILDKEIRRTAVRFGKWVLQRWSI